MSSPANKNKKTSSGKTTNGHKLVYNMMNVAVDTAKNFGGDDIDAKTGGDEDDDVNTDGADETTKTGGNADDKNTGGSYGEAEKNEADSSDAGVVLDPASQADLLSEYDAGWPKTPTAPPSSKTSNTGDDQNADDNDDDVDDHKE
jgi:hypothetical protein